MLIDADSTALEELGFLAISASKALLKKYQDALNKDNMKDKLGFLLCYLTRAPSVSIWHKWEIIRMQ